MALSLSEQSRLTVEGKVEPEAAKLSDTRWVSESTIIREPSLTELRLLAMKQF